MVIRLTPDGDWDRVSRILATSPRKIDEAAEKAALQEARKLQRKIKQGMREQAPAGQRWKPLSPLTLAIRRFTGNSGSKALFVEGDLRNSIKVVKRNDGIFVGVLRSAKGRDGKKLVNIAEIHEFGAGPFVIEVTDKMRKFLAAAFSAELGGVREGGGGFSTGIIVTRIPARPFLRPVFEKYAGKKMEAAFVRRIGEILAIESFKA